ncbi:RING finger protein nhl-1 [Parasteatoda tepidariorum]|uniref:RING finger protein nhl-1 n=1 Tax=Parasteatoda tepidariorum TaxID=114398 RepID=UPI001C718174|nr:RING finger protein nhl-1 [Parasteatoda tepidariorum]
MSSPWNRMDQLLKCSVCSGRFRNPKLLPCNHTFCAEPCLSRCVDKANKHQIKCPECSAEHRMPLQGGVQGFPNNVTLVRFLELRQQVSGREPELPASMQKCNTCKEKGQLVLCAHCNRKVCKECKTAHVNILRKEIALINGQVREGLQQLCNALSCTKENEEKLQKNYSQVKDEIEEVVRRYNRDLLDTESKLKHHLDIYLKNELRSMRRLEHDLEIELNNVNSNCDLVDKYVNNGVDWTDVELTDYKEIFQKTLEFLRAFDSDPADCVRKVKFHPRSDPDVIHKTLIDFAEVKLNEESTPNPNQNENQPLQNGGMYNSSNNLNQGPTVTLTPPKTNALSRSQSDHKLCGQRQSQKRKDQDDNENALSRRFRDKFVREDRDSSERDVPNNRDHSPSSWRRELEEVRHNQKNRFSSREVIDENDDSDTPSRSRSAMEGQACTDHVSETEDATKGPLSGVIRILDSPHVMERLHHSEVKQKRMKEEEERKARMPPPAPPPVSRPMTRQLSEDEIEKQKKENKAAAAAAATSSPSTTAKSGTGVENSRTTKPVPKREEERTPYASRYASSRTLTEETNTPKTRNSSRDEPPLSSASGRRTPKEESQTPTPPPSRLRSWRTTSSAATERDASQSPPSSPTRGRDKPPPSPRTPPASNRPTSRFLPKPSSLDKDDAPADTPRRSNLSTTAGSRSSPMDKRDDRPKLRLSIPQHSPSSSETSSSSESESEDVDSEAAIKRGDISPSVNTLLARSAQARKQSANTQARILNQPEDKLPRPSNRPWRESLRKDEEPSRESLSSPRRKTSIIEPEERTPYSRLFDRRRSSVTSGNTRARDVSPEDNSYLARRNRIARSKSTHDLCPAEDSPEDDTLTAIRNRYRTRRAMRDASPEETAPHSWSQYMKNKYGNSGRPSTTNTGLVRSRTSASLVAPRSESDNSSDEDTPPRRKTDYSRRGDSNSPRGFSLPRRTYMQKGKSCFKFGSRGTEHGGFTWPRGVSVGADNTIVVADSNNHRVQVFSASGKYIQEFGTYGSADGEFDCLAGVTVNRIGQFIVSDRYNHRLQVFDPNGRFIRAFGHEGRSDGKFNYPWGVATDNLGFIYVCDKENHRIQVFQGDGTYVTKFGGIGQRPGELEHPHYVAVSTTNRVIVSDSNNHRIQIYDVNGRLLSTFGTEGSEEGQFKYPRGVAVDDQGYLIVGDSGNNRIQIFHPDGTFLKAFGTWGSGDGEFKGLEGIAVSPTGQILACDRENHRIQVF